MKLREHGFLNNYVVIENCDEFFYCINCVDEKVYSWQYGELELCYDDFSSYLLDRFQEEIDNM